MEDTSSNRMPAEREPGWHPDRMNPNLQKYWDGSEWTATRRWVSGQWVDESPAAPEPSSVPPSTNPGLQQVRAPAHPYASTTPPTARSSTTVTGTSAGLLVCCVLLILGSFTPWITVSFANQSLSAAGTDSSISDLIGINGWITFSAGILLFVLVCMMVVSGEPLFRTLALVIALVTAGVAIYDLVRILQKISQASSPSVNGIPVSGLRPDNSIGWGLIVVVIGAIGALICAVGESRNA